MDYTYTIFDSNPHASSGTAWPSHEDEAFEAGSDADALDFVREIMSTEAVGLSPNDGYEAGDTLYALVWCDGAIVGEPRYELTEDDLA